MSATESVAQAHPPQPDDEGAPTVIDAPEAAAADAELGSALADAAASTADADAIAARAEDDKPHPESEGGAAHAGDASHGVSDPAGAPAQPLLEASATSTDDLARRAGLIGASESRLSELSALTPTEASTSHASLLDASASDLSAFSAAQPSLAIGEPEAISPDDFFAHAEHAASIDGSDDEEPPIEEAHATVAPEADDEKEGPEVNIHAPSVHEIEQSVHEEVTDLSTTEEAAPAPADEEVVPNEEPPAPEQPAPAEEAPAPEEPTPATEPVVDGSAVHEEPVEPETEASVPEPSSHAQTPEAHSAVEEPAAVNVVLPELDIKEPEPAEVEEPAAEEIESTPAPAAAEEAVDVPVIVPTSPFVDPEPAAASPPTVEEVHAEEAVDEPAATESVSEPALEEPAPPAATADNTVAEPLTTTDPALVEAAFAGVPHVPAAAEEQEPAPVEALTLADALAAANVLAVTAPEVPAAEADVVRVVSVLASVPTPEAVSIAPTPEAAELGLDAAAAATVGSTTVFETAADEDGEGDVLVAVTSEGTELSPDTNAEEPEVDSAVPVVATAAPSAEDRLFFADEPEENDHAPDLGAIAAEARISDEVGTSAIDAAAEAVKPATPVISLQTDDDALLAADAGVPEGADASGEIEPPKSPWTPSYSVTRQGPGTPGEAEADAAEVDALEQLPPAIKRSASSSSLSPRAPSPQVAQEEQERPKSPWTPSYSVTTQGPATPHDAQEDKEIAELETLPAPVHQDEEPVLDTSAEDLAEPVKVSEDELTANEQAAEEPEEPVVEAEEPADAVSVPHEDLSANEKVAEPLETTTIAEEAAPVSEEELTANEAAAAPVEEAAHTPSMEEAAEAEQPVHEVAAPIEEDVSANEQAVEPVEALEVEAEDAEHREAPADVDAEAITEPVEEISVPETIAASEEVATEEEASALFEEPAVLADEPTGVSTPQITLQDEASPPRLEPSSSSFALDPPPVAAEIERPKSPSWTPSYSVTTQGPGTPPVPDYQEPAARSRPVTPVISDAPTFFVEEEPAQEAVDEPTESAPVFEEPVIAEQPQIKVDVENVAETAHEEHALERRASATSLQASQEHEVPERPKSPWTPSYSVTRQGPGIPDADRDRLQEQLARALNDSPSETTITPADASQAPTTDIPEPAPASTTGDILEPVEFPAADDEAKSKRPELPALKTGSETAVPPRARNESAGSAASSRYFPGGWFSYAPKTPVLPEVPDVTEIETPVGGPTTLETPIDKKRWCVVM